MDNLITFFDVETPNRKNDRICSIGLVRTDMSGQIVDERYSLINPETPFDEVNMRLHGICGSDVEGMETFPEAWDRWLRDPLVNAPVVAHNAKFDLCVLSKACMAYFDSTPEFSYACTMDLAKSYAPGSQSHKLPDVCDALGISLGHHHNALEDARACAAVFWTMKDSFPDFPTGFRTYKREEEYEYLCIIRNDGSLGFERVEARSGHQPRKCSDKNMVKRFFISLLKDVIKDGNISIDEIVAIQRFIADNNEFLADSKVISSLSEMMQQAAMDGVLDEAESRILQSMVQRIIDPASQNADNIQIEGKTFVVTGTFRHGTRDTVHNYITSHGGTIAKGVTRKCDYVVIGDYGSEAYSLEQYGTKVQKALALQEKGVPIKIAKEADLFGEA